jgi:N12 class adenine-specific DNA methylase
MDNGRKEIQSLEHAENKNLVKVNIFNRPIAFNSNEIIQADISVEALSALLNKFGKVNIRFILSLMLEKSAEEIIEELYERIYYNLLINNYETSNRFIA